ncbi:MAG: hypothetical protein MPJ25_10765 [Pirellulales bacterium]|nr:hypothetical protein [Pirellulales bacterium]
MAIRVDNVYQTILALLNREQRGWFTPEEFNRAAYLAQSSIFEKTFEEETNLKVNRKWDSMKAMHLREKIEVFKTFGAATSVSNSNIFTLPSDLYRLDVVEVTMNEAGVDVKRRASLLPTTHIQFIERSDKQLISAFSPKFVRRENTDAGLGQVELFPSTIVSGVSVWYTKSPSDPIWGFDRFGSSNTPAYNPAKSNDFDLHISERPELIKRILFYAGINLREADVQQVAAGDLAGDQAIENQ